MAKFGFCRSSFTLKGDPYSKAYFEAKATSCAKVSRMLVDKRQGKCFEKKNKYFQQQTIEF